MTNESQTARQTPDRLPVFLTKGELVRQTGLGRRFWDAAEASGGIRPIRAADGGWPRFSLGEVDEYLEGLRGGV